MVQAITVSETIIQGSHPCQSGTEDAERRPSAEFATLNSGSSAGRQTWRNRSVAASEPSEESTSVSV